MNDIVIHLFDTHFADPRNGWTIEMIADWLASVDPTPVEVPVEEVHAELASV